MSNNSEQQERQFCAGCGQELEKGAGVCVSCGRLAPTADGVSQQGVNNIHINLGAGVSQGKVKKDKWVALAFCLLLGGIGGHKFYEGKTGLGVLYLIFCWTCIPAVIAVIECIQYALREERYYYID